MVTRAQKLKIAGGVLNLSAEVPEVKMDETTGEVGQSKNHLVTDPFGVPCMVEYSTSCVLF